MLSSGAAVFLNVPLRQPHASEFSAPRPSVVKPIGQDSPMDTPARQYSPTWHGSQESTLAE
eukprot:scaffold12111_cov66-Phaeocystis_antarctica.AAC.4